MTSSPQTIFFETALDPRRKTADTRARNSEPERFYEVIVRTQIEHRNDIVFAAFDAEHDDRRCRNLADLSTHFETAESRHHEIQEDQVRSIRVELTKRSDSVRGDDHFVTVRGERRRDRRDDAAIVVDEENPSTVASALHLTVTRCHECYPAHASSRAKSVRKGMWKRNVLP